MFGFSRDKTIQLTFTTSKPGYPSITPLEIVIDKNQGTQLNYDMNSEKIKNHIINTLKNCDAGNDYCKEGIVDKEDPSHYINSSKIFDQIRPHINKKGGGKRKSKKARKSKRKSRKSRRTRRKR